MTLSQIIKSYRTKNKMNMREFAKKAQISRSYVSLLEHNKHPDTGKPITPTLEKTKNIAHAMDMSLDELVSLLDHQKISRVEKNKAVKPDANPKTSLEKKEHTDVEELLEKIKKGLNERAYADDDRFETREYSEETRAALLNAIDYALGIIALEKKKVHT